MFFIALVQVYGAHLVYSSTSIFHTLEAIYPNHIAISHLSRFNYFKVNRDLLRENRDIRREAIYFGVNRDITLVAIYIEVNRDITIEILTLKVNRDITLQVIYFEVNRYISAYLI